MSNAVSGSGHKAGKPAQDRNSNAYAAGWNDRKSGLPFRAGYESMPYGEQRNYEMGRAMCAITLKPRRIRLDHSLRGHFDRLQPYQRTEHTYQLSTRI
jgi:hypothetical protein